MPDETPQGGETPPNTPPGDGAGTDDDGEPFDPARAKATIEKLRGFEKQSKAQERELAQVRAKLKELEDAKLSETEKTMARVKELETERETWQRERREHFAEKAIIREATALKAKAPDRLLKIILPDLEYDAEGKPTNVAALLKDLLKDVPEFFNSQNGSADGGAGNGRAPSGFDMNAEIRKAAGRA